MSDPILVRLPDGTTVHVSTADGVPDGTPTATWLAQRLCTATPHRPDRVEVCFGAPTAGQPTPVSVTLAWDRAPAPPSVTLPGTTPGVVRPTQRPGAAPPGLTPPG